MLLEQGVFEDDGGRKLYRTAIFSKLSRITRSTAPSPSVNKANKSKKNLIKNLNLRMQML